MTAEDSAWVKKKYINTQNTLLSIFWKISKFTKNTNKKETHNIFNREYE